MQAGDTIGRRFLLVRADAKDLPGLDRYLAKDTRLHEDVTVDVITSRAPSAVVRAAQKARVLRDRRLGRVLAAGIERVDGERIFYVVTERPCGVRLDGLIGKVAFDPASAAAVIGQAAAGLATVLGTGTHHGLIRASSITVNDRGRVMLSGLGVDGVLAAQAGRVKVTNERTDAVALASLYLAAITAMDPADVTVADIPDDVTAGPRRLCRSVIKGSGPTTLAEVIDALGTGNARMLKALVAEAPSLWWPRTPAVAPIAAASPAVDGVLADVASSPDVIDTENDRAGDDIVEAEIINGDVVTADAFDSELIEGDILEMIPERPRTRFGGAVDDLDEFHDIVDAQNQGTQESVVEAVLERLHRRFPRSAPLANAAAVAHRRAQAAAPLNVGPLLVALLIVAVFVSAIIAAALITKPYVPDFDGHNNPPQTYPEFTVGMTPTPS